MVEFCGIKSIIRAIFLSILVPNISKTIISALRPFHLLTSGQDIDELGLCVAVVLLILGDINAVSHARLLEVGVVSEVGVLLVNDCGSDFGLSEDCCLEDFSFIGFVVLSFLLLR